MPRGKKTKVRATSNAKHKTLSTELTRTACQTRRKRSRKIRWIRQRSKIRTTIHHTCMSHPGYCRTSDILNRSWTILFRPTVHCEKQSPAELLDCPRTVKAQTTIARPRRAKLHENYWIATCAHTYNHTTQINAEASQKHRHTQTHDAYIANHRTKRRTDKPFRRNAEEQPTWSSNTIF